MTPSPEKKPQNTSSALERDYYAGITLEKARLEIARNFPAFADATIERPKRTGGFNNDVFIVNGEYLFRFPKDAKATRHLNREIVLLPLLRNNLRVAIPAFTFIGTIESDPARPFVGYRLLSGIPLDEWEAPKRDPVTRLEIASQIGSVLAELHSINPDFIPKELRAKTNREPQQMIFEFLDCGKTSAFQIIRDALGEEAQSLIDKIEILLLGYINSEKKFAPSTVHGDFALEHILVDQKSKKITGVIDWSTLGAGDSAEDFWRFSWMLDEETMRALVTSYGRESYEQMIPRMKAFTVGNMLYRLKRNQDIIKQARAHNDMVRAETTEQNNELVFTILRKQVS